MTIFSTSLTPLAAALVIILGVVSSYTDIRSRTIRNMHLAVFVLVAFGLQAVLSGGVAMPAGAQPLNVLLASVLALVMYFSGHWRGGDAKLFMAYACIMPATGYERVIPFPCLTFFAITFFIALLALLPSVARTIGRDPAAFLRETFSRRTLSSLASALGFSFIVCATVLPFVPWRGQGLPPFYGAAINFGLFWVCTFLLTALSRVHKHALIAITVVLPLAVFLVRLVFWPATVALQGQWRIVLSVVVFSCIAHVLRRIFKHLERPEERVPFAPFLFAGCLLSYTPFLAWVMALLRR